MNRAATVTRTLTVRVQDQDYLRMEQVRDQERFPTQSDFIREAIRRMVREERRDRAREESKVLARQQMESEDSRLWAEAAAQDLAERWARADRGEL